MAYEDLPPVTDQYDITEQGSRDYETLLWCEAKLDAGRAFVEASPGYDKIQPALDEVMSLAPNPTQMAYAPPPISGLSETRANLTAKTAEDLTALLTDTRVFWNYSTYNARYQEQARLANKTAESWYVGRCIDLRIADGIRYYTAAGSTYIHLFYSRRLDDMMVDAIDPRQVFPIDPISYHTVQDARGVILRVARTPQWVKEEYGKDVPPDVGDPGIFGWAKRMLGGVAEKVVGPLSASRRAKSEDQAIPSTPTVFVNTLYLDDKRLNKKDKPVYMGPWEMKDEFGLPLPQPKPQASWSYKVMPGQPLFPYKRLIAWTRTTLLYDGTSPYWHAKYPLIKLTLSPWPKCWLGKAPLWDVMPLTKSYNDKLRVVDDHIAQVAQPGVIADKNVARNEVAKFNSRRAGWSIRTNSAAGKGIQVVPPPALDASVNDALNRDRDLIREMSGTGDISQLAQLNQIPSDDTIDTLMKAMTPGVRLRSRILEGFMKEFAEMYLYCIFQFDTIIKRTARFGPEAITNEDFDFIPGSMIPDHVPDGSPGDVAGHLNALALENPPSRYDRAKIMLASFTYNFSPASLLNSAAMQDKMEDFLLAKMGYISWFTLMERLGKSNLWPPGLKVPDDELSRLQLQQQLGIGMVANAQGRKASDQAPPSMNVQNDGSPGIQTS